MSAPRPRHPAFVLVALAAMTMALATSLVAVTDFHGPLLSTGSATSLAEPGSPPSFEGTACSACLLRTQLEGSDLAPAMSELRAELPSEALRLGPPAAALAAPFSVQLARGPPCHLLARS